MSKYRTKIDTKNWILGSIALLIVIAVACGAESSITPASSDSQPTSSSPAVTEGDSGLDEACVQRVLGRTATGFGDISSAERDAVFEQCSGTESDRLTRQFTTGGGGNLLENLDAACVTEITGQDELDLGQLSIEQRQQVVTECAPEGFQRGAPGGRDFGGGFADFSSILEGCATEALGETPESLFGLTPEQTEAITAACGDELPDGFGGFGGFPQGGDGGGFFGGGLRGQDGGREGTGGFGFRGFDFSSDCVTSTVGRPVTGPGDLTQTEFQQIFANCS